MAAPIQNSAALLWDDGIWRDSVRQPIYSSAGLNTGALPSELQFFNYARGQNVPGAGNFAGIASTVYNTNMDMAGQLGRPKKYRCDGLRVHLPSIAASGSGVPALTDPSFAAAASQDDELLEDWLVIVYSTFLQLRIGEKYYANHPLWYMPSNTGFDGVAAVAQDNGTAATTANLSLGLYNGKGTSLGINLIPFLIEMQQTITCTLRCPWTSPSLNDHHILFVYLTGNLYREVS